MPVTDQELEMIAVGFAPVLRDELKQRDARIAALEARVDAFERKPYVRFMGAYSIGQAYSTGDAVVHKSALWIAKAPNYTEPSVDFASWQLAVKRGEAR